MDQHSVRRWLSQRKTQAISDRVERSSAWRQLGFSLPTGLKLNGSPDGGQPEAAGAAVERLQRQLAQAQVDAILTLVAAIEAKDAYTEHHSLHVPQYAECLARRMQIGKRETEIIKKAALLHDCGKIGVPDAILTKPGPLTVEEFEIIKQHPVTGAAILSAAASLQRELPLVLYHHERYDGTGYPEGLRGRQIPLGARILHVADAIDAMICPRSYKRGMNIDEVMSELRLWRGTQFDPVIADVALQWLTERPEDLKVEGPEMRACHAY
jgi:putative nucleotidyltransferase with HDIG domain